jgi:hypothetical protein
MKSTGHITARGAFTGDFGISPDAPAHQIPGEIERDREIMVQRPGMLHKHVPIQVDPESGRMFCGGRYLFDSYDDAEAYRRWVLDDFVVDGVPFPERSYFVDPVFLAWHVVGAHDFDPIDTHVAIRFERWALSGPAAREVLDELWPAARKEARERGLASVWVLYSEERREAGLVTVAKRSGQAAPGEVDEASLALLRRPSIGAALEARGLATSVLDRAGLVWTIWLPRAAAGEAPSLWPNSPPLPAPVLASR